VNGRKEENGVVLLFTYSGKVGLREFEHAHAICAYDRRSQYERVRCEGHRRNYDCCGGLVFSTGASGGANAMRHVWGTQLLLIGA